MRPAGPTDGDQTEGTRKGEGRGRGIELSDPARVNLLPAHEPPDRSRRGNEADSLGRQLFPPHYFGGYELQGCRARRWFSGSSLLEGEGEGERDAANQKGRTNFASSTRPATAGARPWPSKKKAADSRTESASQIRLADRFLT